MKLKVKELSYTVKPKQTEGKLVVQDYRYSVKPKQTEGKLLVLGSGFVVKPKPDGVKIYRTKNRSVLKRDSRSGAKVYREAYSSVLKRDARTGVRLYRANNTRVLRQTCDGTIFTWDATVSVFRPPNGSLTATSGGSVSSSFLSSGGLSTRIYDTERPVVLGITWSNTISGGVGGANFPDGTYPETSSRLYFYTQIQKTPTAVNSSAGAVTQQTLGLTGMNGTTGITFPFDSASGTYWLRFVEGIQSGTPSIASGTKYIRQFTVRNVSDGNAFMFNFLLGVRIT
jgi:hypothetical protein